MNDSAQAREELETFKRLPLPDVLRKFGYSLDFDKSTHRNPVMFNEGGDSVVCFQRVDGAWGWFDRQNRKGSVIDFLQTRYQLSLGHVRGKLRAIAGQEQKPFFPLQSKTLPPADTLENRERLHKFWEGATAGTSAYLLKRGLNEETQNHFRGAFRIRRNRTCCFPHRNPSGELVGLELRSETTKTMFQGSVRSVWSSGKVLEKRHILICESALDCLSHFQLFSDSETGYLATGGSLGKNQKSLLRERLSDYSGNLLIGTDNDQAGDAMAAELMMILPNARRERPPAGLKDWNDAVNAK